MSNILFSGEGLQLDLNLNLDWMSFLILFINVSIIGIKVHEVNDALIDVNIFFVITIFTKEFH